MNETNVARFNVEEEEKGRKRKREREWRMVEVSSVKG